MSGGIGEYISSMVIPLIVCVAGVFMAFGKNEHFAAFIEGAKEGLVTAVKLLPTLVALVVAIGMLNASGAIEFFSSLLSPVSECIGVPSGLLPLLLTRPFSGSASMASFSGLLGKYGADSLICLSASVIMGSSDTLVYVISVYFSSVGIKKTRYCIPCAAAAMIFCIFFSCFICEMWFGK